MSLELLRFLGQRFARKGEQGFFRVSRVVAFVSVALGSMALVLALAILEGFQQTLLQQATRFTWHVQVRTVGGTAFAYGAVVERLRSGFPGAVIAPVREREALVRFGRELDGVLLRAVGMARDSLPQQFHLLEGAGMPADTALELLLGEALARRLSVRAGDTVVLITAAGTPLRPTFRRVRVAGIYRGGLTRYEELYAFVPFGAMARLLELPDFAATGVDMLLPVVDSARAAPERIAGLLGFPFYGVSVYELHQPMFAWIELQRVPIPLVLGLFTLVAAFNVLTFLVLLIAERMPSFAVLQALGMSAGQMRNLLLWQGFGVSLAGALMGCAVALLLCLVQAHFGIIRLQGALYHLDRLPVAFVMWHPALVVAVAVGLSVAVSMIPARLLRRLPLTALLHLR
jgi:lipoprotein-releasing system permease protein